ncbi:MAG: RagB/SusD family nutrient uptake outer membrane protein [Cyclobacteriaceae bacterium]|nr:RagB/SusD family nutrient uptake outer membrane protein [Cyclobacteriaceae bacterium]UYN85558.1 MAG: RagB/SusD family nutrient uptake outer membrane protein [Cyclobacteriaceae bacterium]
MKKYTKYFISVVLLITFSACTEDFLEYVPEDRPTVNSWYRNKAEIRQATASLYGRVWWGVNDQFSWLAGDVMAGDMHHNWDAEGQFFYMSFNESNQYIGQGWQGFYDVISFANLIIDDMPTIASGYGVSQSIINEGLGEARFMRGIAYFLLAEYWGEAPIIEKPAEKVAKGELLLPKNTTASLYEFARRDLVFAAENLPATDDPGRVTQWAAKGMLAKLHLALAQRSVGGGTIGSSNDFTLAANYAADVINNSGRSLNASYEDLFKVQNEHNPEILFAPQLINGGWGFGSSRQARFARSTIVTGDATAWGSGKCPTVSLINTVSVNAGGKTDLRRRAIYMQNGDYYNYLATERGGYTYKIVSRDAENTVLEGSTPTLTSLKKHIIGNDKDNGGYAITNQDSPLDIYYLRLADVYLLYTEALMGSSNELTGGPGLASLNAVRARAGLDPRTTVTYQQLFNERRIELALEAQSWIDIKRRYYRNPEEALNYLNGQNRTDMYFRINTNDALENDPAGYELVPAGTTSANNNTNTDPIVVFTATKMRLPIPGNQVVINPLLAPNREPVEYEFN